MTGRPQSAPAKSALPLPVIIGVIALVVLLAGWLGFRLLAPAESPAATTAAGTQKDPADALRQGASKTP